MAFEKKAMVMAAVVVLLVAAIQLSEGVVYKVGDSTGWTTMGNFDYQAWSSNKTFRVGDTILFEYNAQFHNVVQVNHTEYNACDVSSPIVTHTTGNDSIKITKTGHLYFICGVPGHCQAGQKVDIRVPTLSSMAPGGGPAMSPGPSSTPSDSMSPNSMAPGSMIPGAMAPGAMTPGSMPPGSSPRNTASLTTKGSIGFIAFTVAVFAGLVAF